MPILYNERPLFRVKFKDANIKEVRRGTELEWGLYEITYFTGSDSIQNTENITEYVWGYPGYVAEDFILSLPEGDDSLYGGFSASKAGELFGSGNAYRTCGKGWYADPECLTYIPAITRNFHRDLLLFCKWAQRKYTWGGTIKNDRYYWDDGSGGGGSGGKYPQAPALGTDPDSLNSSYYNMSSAYKGECTWYAHGRTAEMRGNLGAAAPFGDGHNQGGYGNAWDWYSSGGCGGHWSRTSNWSDVRAGDVVVFGEESPGHVAVVEWKDSSNATLSAFNNPSAGYNHKSLGLLPWTPGSNFNGPKYTWGNATGKFRGYIINHTDKLVEDSGGGGEAGWVFERVEEYTPSPDENVCGEGTWASGSGSQNYPRVPERYDQAQEDAVPGKHWRKDERWEPVNLKTYIRYITYQETSEDSYTPVFSNWILEDSASLEGTYLCGYDTNAQGPIDGWKMYWDED